MAMKYSILYRKISFQTSLSIIYIYIFDYLVVLYLYVITGTFAIYPDNSNTTFPSILQNTTMLRMKKFAKCK